MSDFRLTTGERAVLRELEELGERTVPQMADRRGISRQAIQRTVDLLDERGLVSKHVPETDKRSRVLRLTDQGKLQLEKLAQLRACRSTGYREKSLRARSCNR